MLRLQVHLDDVVDCVDAISIASALIRQLNLNTEDLIAISKHLAVEVELRANKEARIRKQEEDRLRCILS